MNFDESLKKLEELSSKMSSEDLTLDESVKIYNEGVELSKKCLDELNGLTGKIFVIKQDMEKFKEVQTEKENIDATK